MTTKVVIAVMPEQQPDVEVHVHVEMRNNEGRFERSRSVVLQSGEVAEMYIHSGCQLAVHEHRKPAPAADEPDTR